jgi:hypothetical protein
LHSLGMDGLLAPLNTIHDVKPSLQVPPNTFAICSIFQDVMEFR